MKEIIDHVFLGNSTDATGFIERDFKKREWVNPNNVIAVVNCTGLKPYQDNEKEVENYYDDKQRKKMDIPYKIDYLFLNIFETSKITREMADNIIKFIEKNIICGNVIVHCVAGLQRSPSVILVYLLSKGIPFIEGLHLIEERKGANIYPTLPMLRSIAKLEIDGKTVHDDVITRFTKNYRYW